MKFGTNAGPKNNDSAAINDHPHPFIASNIPAIAPMRGKPAMNNNMNNVRMKFKFCHTSIPVYIATEQNAAYKMLAI